MGWTEFPAELGVVSTRELPVLLSVSGVSLRGAYVGENSSLMELEEEDEEQLTLDEDLG